MSATVSTVKADHPADPATASLANLILTNGDGSGGPPLVPFPATSSTTEDPRPLSPSRIGSPTASLPDASRTPRFTLLKRPSTSPEPGMLRSRPLEDATAPRAASPLGEPQAGPSNESVAPGGLDKAISEAIGKGTIRDKQVMLQAEGELRRFVASGAARATILSPTLNMTALNSYQRLLVHRLGDAFGVRRSVEGGQLILERTASSAWPSFQLAKLLNLDEPPSEAQPNATVPTPSIPPPPTIPSASQTSLPKLEENTASVPPVLPSDDGPAIVAPIPKSIKIMSRTSSERSVPRGSVVPSPASGSVSDGDAAKAGKSKEALSLEARQAAYDKARERIFAANQPAPVAPSPPAEEATSNRVTKPKSSPATAEAFPSGTWSRSRPPPSAPSGVAFDPGAGRLRVDANAFDPIMRGDDPDFRRNVDVLPMGQSHGFRPASHSGMMGAGPVRAPPTAEYPVAPPQHFAHPRYDPSSFVQPPMPQGYIPNATPAVSHSHAQYTYPSAPMHPAAMPLPHRSANSSPYPPYPPPAGPFYAPLPAPQPVQPMYSQPTPHSMPPPSAPLPQTYRASRPVGTATHLRPYVSDPSQPAPYPQPHPDSQPPIHLPQPAAMPPNQQSGWPGWYEAMDGPQRHDYVARGPGSTGIPAEQASYLRAPSDAGSDSSRPAMRQSMSSASSASSLAYVPHRPASALSSSSGSSILTASSSFSRGRGPPMSGENHHHLRSLRQTSYPVLSSQAVARLSPENSRHYQAGSAGGGSSRSSQHGGETVPSAPSSSSLSMDALRGASTPPTLSTASSSAGGSSSRNGSEAGGSQGSQGSQAADGSNSVSMCHPLPPKPTWAVHPPTTRR